MPLLPRLRRTSASRALPVLILALVLASVPTFATDQSASSIGDTVDVEIKIVPFYAVDADGKPVFDLKQDEVEIRVDGKPVPIDSFDVPRGSQATPAKTAPDIANPWVSEQVSEKDGSHPVQRRHVVLFFDVAFSRVPGFQKAQTFAQKIIEDTPEQDYLYLLVHDFKSGLKQELGPITADSVGKARMIERIRKMKPEIGQLDAHAESRVDLYSSGSPKQKGMTMDQNSAISASLRTNSQAQLEGTARSLSESLTQLAAQFQRINEPKLLIFLSQGIDPTLYWEGSDVGLQFGTQSSAWRNIKSYQFRGLHGLYDKPLRELADTGAMSLFVNLDDKAGESESSLHHMALNGGGLYLGGGDASQVAKRAESSTAAYYEAGFYLNDQTRTASRAKIDIVIKRPGIQTFSAGALKAHETWRGLNEDARRLLIVDLIEGNIGDMAAQRARSSVRLDYHNLPGNVVGRADSGRTLLRYEAGWPQELAGRKVDLYNVVLEPTRQTGSPNILHFDRKASTRVDQAGAIEVEVPDKAQFLWGIVAVEPESGRAWYRRFHLQGKPPTK
jgi:VWFA-related protein